MDKTDKNIKNQNSIRKTTRRGSLKSLVGSVEAKRSPILVEVSPARRQNARIKKTTKTPEKQVVAQTKLVLAPLACKSETTNGESSNNNNGGGAVDYAALIN